MPSFFCFPLEERFSTYTILDFFLILVFVKCHSTVFWHKLLLIRYQTNSFIVVYRESTFHFLCFIYLLPLAVFWLSVYSSLLTDFMFIHACTSMCTCKSSFLAISWGACSSNISLNLEIFDIFFPNYFWPLLRKILLTLWTVDI